MEESGRAQIDVINSAVRRRRSQPFRRPRPDESNDQSSSSPARASDDASKGSSDETTGGDTNSSRRKEFNLNQCVARVSSSSVTEAEKLHQNVKSEDGSFTAFYINEPTRSGSSNKRSSEGVLAPANWKNTTNSRDDNYRWQNGENPSPVQPGAALDDFGNENNVKKLKLKVLVLLVQAPPPMVHLRAGPQRVLWIRRVVCRESPGKISPKVALVLGSERRTLEKVLLQRSKGTNLNLFGRARGYLRNG